MKKNFKQNLIAPIVVLIITAAISGCIFKQEDKLLPADYDKEKITIKYLQNNGTLLTKEDFPGFQPLESVHLIAPENISLTLQTESMHMAAAINLTDQIPNGYRLYGGYESYNASKRFLLLQYKVFDTNESLNDSMDLTIADYTKAGFKTKILKNVSYDGRIFVFERAANETGMNVTVILLENDTILGKIGVQDTKDKSLNESLKMLNIMTDRMKVGTKSVVKMDINSYVASHASQQVNDSEANYSEYANGTTK